MNISDIRSKYNLDDNDVKCLQAMWGGEVRVVNDDDVLDDANLFTAGGAGKFDPNAIMLSKARELMESDAIKSLSGEWPSVTFQSLDDSDYNRLMTVFAMLSADELKAVLSCEL